MTVKKLGKQYSSYRADRPQRYRKLLARPLPSDSGVIRRTSGGVNAGKGFIIFRNTFLKNLPDKPVRLSEKEPLKDAGIDG